MREETIEDLLFSWGAWRSRGLKAQPIRGAAMHTPGATDVSASYKQICGPCRGKGVDLSEVGCRVVRSSDLGELKKKYPCPVCKGRGYKTVKAMKADPGAIPRTGPGGMQINIDEMPSFVEQIEGAMDQVLHHHHKLVLTARYVVYPRARSSAPGTDGRQARVGWVNAAIQPDKITLKSFDYLLAAAHARLANELNIPRKIRRKQYAS